jgi:DNA repair protein RadC
MTTLTRPPTPPLMLADVPAMERPRERLHHAGAAALSNAELLAILLRTGTAAESVLALAGRLLATLGGLEGLAKARFDDLTSLHGFGEAKAAQLLAALELGRRVSAVRGDALPVISGPEDAARLLRGEMAFLEQEHFRVLVLNTRNQVLAAPTVFVGSVNATAIRTAEVFREAVRRNAPSVIVAHNHPSGDPTPSPQDEQVTRALVSAGRALDIAVLDHVVIARDGHASLRERGVPFD